MTVRIVRHAEPEVVPGDDPRRWVLSQAGRSAARELRTRLPQTGVWVSSTEAKAHETLLCAADPDVVVAQDPRFDEVLRSEPFDEEFRARRRAWVRGDLGVEHTGWETPQEAAVRFGRAVAEHASGGTPLVIASHGMVITAWLVHGRHLLRPQEAADFWEAMAFPDVIDAG